MQFVNLQKLNMVGIASESFVEYVIEQHSTNSYNVMESSAILAVFLHCNTNTVSFCGGIVV